MLPDHLHQPGAFSNACVADSRLLTRVRYAAVGDRGLVPWRVAASLAVACLGLATGAPLLGWAGAASWSGLTLTFCLRRLRATSKSPSHVAEMALTSGLIPPLSLYWRLQGILQFG